MLSRNDFPTVRRTAGGAALRLLAVTAVLVAPLLGGTSGISAPSAAAAAPLPQPAAASFSDGRCTSGDLSAVTVVIDFQELGGGTVVRCGHGLQPGANGIAAMRAAGIAFDGNARFGSAFVCRILGRPSASEALPIDGGGYREKCIDTSPAQAYWSYWQASENGPWAYSSLGIGSSKARLGGFEGWSFSLNKTSSTNPTPRLATTLDAPAPPPTTTQPPTAGPPATTPPTTRPTSPAPAPKPTPVRPPTTKLTTAPGTTSTATQPRPTTDAAPAGTAEPTAPAPTPSTPTTDTRAPDPRTNTAGEQPDTPAAPVDGGVPATSTPDAVPTAPRATTPSPTTTGSAAPTTTVASAGPSAMRSTSSSDTAPSSRAASRSQSGVPGSPPTSQASAGLTSAGQVTPIDPAGVDPDVAAQQIEPASSSPWPVIAVSAGALIAGGAAFAIARRRRGDGV